MSQEIKMKIKSTLIGIWFNIILTKNMVVDFFKNK
jgi:hypothetical protein